MLRLVLLAILLSSASAAARAPRPPEPEPKGPKTERRKDPEPSPGGQRSDMDLAPLFLDHTDRTGLGGGCHVRGFERLRQRLLGLENATQYMSLEVWGDAQAYGPYQKVLFHLRVPRAAYITLYWLGPAGHITVPIDNVRVPAERDVTIDTGGIIVPPYGQEQWVAIATLEPFPVGCSTEDAMLGHVERRLKTVHGIGRWAVRSLESP